MEKFTKFAHANGEWLYVRGTDISMIRKALKSENGNWVLIFNNGKEVPVVDDPTLVPGFGV